MPGTPKDDFLRNVQAALGNPANRPAPDYLPLMLRQNDQRQRLITVEARAEAKRPRLLERLADMSQKQGWVVHRVTSVEDVVSRLVGLAHQRRARSIVRSAHEVFQRVPIDSALRGQGLEVTPVLHGPNQTREALREAMAGADIGVTGVDYGIAETGTVVLAARRGISRLVSLLPPVHVALVEPHQVYESLDDLWALRRMAFLEGNGDMGSYLSLTSGPSRTADIEQQLVVGVHGPVEVHMIILEG